MLKEGRAKGIDPAVRRMIDRIRTLSSEDHRAFIECLRKLHDSDDQDEYESLTQAIEELWEQKPVIADAFPLAEQPMSEGLKKWAEHVGRRIQSLRKKAGLRQTELAKAADLPLEYVRLIEKAQESASNLALTKIARALRVDIGVIDPTAD